MASTLALDPRAGRRVLADLIRVPLGAKAREAALIAAGAGLTGLAAQISIPVHGSPVPVTGQTFGVLLVGAALGARRGAASMALYLLAGFVGVPWFAGATSGSIHLATLGYLVGFILAGALVGRLAERGADRSPWRTAVTMAAGNVVIYACGVPYLAWSAHLPMSEAVHYGLTVFLLGDALKILLAAGLLPGAWKFAGERGVGH
ncbi:biotin transporter BioY [Actinospica sp. MGRD01-02]|uniref:Biotin transporter n=1 Tax=Actinospica acidithermotolerans TaxID=2828514 RepID=A0A941E4D5_9ACTN|nr:biotin transporter BioY [Actinospica acidithermotolerans]MBR7824931.1 biotin transporter BioY [Actinospica acidithermotolerans]